MTHIKNILIATTTVLALAAVPTLAFSQMTDAEMQEAMKAKQLHELALKNMRTDEHSEHVADMSNKDRIDHILQSNETMETTTADDALLMASGDLISSDSFRMKAKDNEIENNMIVVPTLGTNLLTTVACPIGTTAQANETCLITGNYKY